ncbi:MAG: hypothetical protein JWO32_449 [Bacteroidetes bacterium]|nr:hypothetical protein [Bacteroidota bacterium]
MSSYQHTTDLQSMPTLIKFLVILLFNPAMIQAQPGNGELIMTFPSIYFKHNSAEYAIMPYTVDSCFKFITANIKFLNSYPIWKDSSETELLTNKRIKKLKDDINKLRPTGKLNINLWEINKRFRSKQLEITSTLNKSNIYCL